MDIVKQIKDKIKVGVIFNNPGGGVSEVYSITDIGIYYKRRNSKILLKFIDIADVYEKFYNSEITTNNLKDFRPEVFDSNASGHSCNCTFLFLLLKECGVVKGDIQGLGRRGNPYYITIT